MKNFRDFLNEEVLPTVQVADGGLDISKPAVRAAINAAIAGVVSQPAVTPYVVFNRLSKLLAQYHIVLPKRFLEGDKGVEVFELKQFGHKMGMTDSGEFINDVPSTHYLFMQYGIITPFGITYAKPIVGGMFKVMARVVDKAELDKLIDMAEITMAEEAEVNQAIAKANAPKEKMHTALGDCDCSQGDSPSTKSAIATSEKKSKSLDEEERPNAWGQYPKEAKQIRKQLRQEKKAKAFAKAQAKTVKEDEDLDEAKMTMTQKRNAIMRFMSHNPEAGKSILKTGEKDRAEKKAFASGKSEINRMKKKNMEEERIEETHADNIRRKYREKEDSNDHTGNVHLLTRVFGKKKEQETSKEMLRKRNKQGHVSHSDSQKGYKITKKYASRLDKLKEDTLDEVSLGKLVRYKNERDKDVRVTGISASHSEDMAKHHKATGNEKKSKEFGDEGKWLRGKQEKMKAGIKLADAKMKGKAKVGASMPKHPYMEEKDPCWKGYEMIGMKKKGGKPVPNCVPVKEEQIDEISKKLAFKAVRSGSGGDPDYDHPKKDAIKSAIGRKWGSEAKKHADDADEGKDRLRAPGKWNRLKNDMMSTSNRVSASGKKNKQDVASTKRNIRSRLGTHPKPGHLPEAYEKQEAGVKTKDGKTHTLHRRNPGHPTEYHTVTTKDAEGKTSVKVGKPKYIKKHWDKLEEKAPPGREKQVLALKKKFPKGSGSPFAIAWSSYNKSKGE